MKTRIRYAIFAALVIALLVLVYRYGNDLPKKSVLESVADTAETVLAEETAETVVPPPVDPETVVITEETGTATLTVVCKAVLERPEKLAAGKEEIIPQDGVMLAEKSASFFKGETALQFTARVLREEGIPMEFTRTAVIGAVYVEGIGNLYEFDCGEGSGWLYSVNGAFPPYAASSYGLRDGDKVAWVYTLDRGADAGQKNAAVTQKNDG